MFVMATEELEVTKDVNRANELLDKGWMLSNVQESPEHEFIFLMARHERHRNEIFGYDKVENDGVILV